MSLKVAFGFTSGVNRLNACRFLQQRFGGNIKGIYDPIHNMIRNQERELGIQINNKEDLARIYMRAWAAHNSGAVWPRHLLNTFDRGQNVFVPDLAWPCHADLLRRNNFRVYKLSVPGVEPANLRRVTPSARIRIRDEVWDGEIVHNSLGELEESLSELFPLT